MTWPRPARRAPSIAVTRTAPRAYALQLANSYSVVAGRPRRRPMGAQLDQAALAHLLDVEFNGESLHLAVLRGFRAALSFHRTASGGSTSGGANAGGSIPSLDDLMALSGDAFHLVHGEHWQGAAHLYIPTDPIANLAAVCGLRCTALHRGPTAPFAKRPDALELTHADLENVYAEIDAGRPVLTAGAIETCGHYSLIVGYDRSDGPMLCHVGDGGSRWSLVRGVSPGAVDYDAGFNAVDGQVRGTVHDGFMGGWIANPFYLLAPAPATEAEAPAPDAASGARSVLLATLQRAVELYHAPPFHRQGWGVYFFGHGAYVEWAAALRRLDYPADLAAEQTGSFDCFTMTNMQRQLEQIQIGRAAAAQFLETASDSVTVSDEARRLMREAAEKYRAEVAIATESRGFREFRGAADDDVDAANASRERWFSDPAACAVGAALVENMGTLEQQAVAAIEAALLLLAAPTSFSAAMNSGVTEVVPLLDVEELSRSIEFYVDTLGFEIRNSWSEGNELRWCRLQMGGAGLMVQQFRGHHSGAGSTPRMSLCFFCESAVEMWRKLSARGASPSHPQVLNGLWCTEVTDPDGVEIVFESVQGDAVVAEGAFWREMDGREARL